ncbi:hypothetical protein QUF80_18355 [Desulfococcaceae bacterium HSG8]|nr:hypothetical protein [Desulfococcaceae bacterium HSG8]
MNIYIVVEGLAERKIFPYWIKILKPELTQVFTIDEVIENNFYLISGNGFPSYYDYIKDAIDTINSTNNFDKLIIAIDSEDQSRQEKYEEVNAFLADKTCTAEIRIILQHFCLETWLLGNKRVGPRNPKTQELRTFKEYFDVFTDDPELLPDYPIKSLNRSQFAFLYLKKMLKEKRMNYSKGVPKAICHPRYLEEVKRRHETSSHINSFGSFLDAFNF